jgi:Lon protease-like protein
MATAEIALFPLKTVLFPGGPLQLRVFEPRYVDMVGRCMKQDTGFGVVGITSGSEVGEAETYDVGTLAEIVSWYRDERGLLGIEAVGRGRFAIESRSRRPDGLYVAEVRFGAPEPPTALPDRYRPSAEFLRVLLPQLGSRYSKIDLDLGDASWVGRRFAEILPLDTSTKQDLLEMNDPISRLDALIPLIERLRGEV